VNAPNVAFPHDFQCRQVPMAKSTIAARGVHPETGRGHVKPLPLSKTRVRWRRALRLLLAVPVGFFIGGSIVSALGLDDDADAAAAEYCGIALPFALFLVTIWCLGVSRRAAFAEVGGDPDAAGVLLFGVMKPRSRSGSSGSGGYYGDGGSSGGCGGGDWQWLGQPSVLSRLRARRREAPAAVLFLLWQWLRQPVLPEVTYS
jgi:hypothetical protein